ncbi:hypothetical protein FISHEDRAFT_55126 [Fistulina hepatica ATCC 64428]|uniref:SET domain-containing protein n=1 Tax=Fistulina hepatica ATCC 64428 TaxID=1128425 RepID=A0A0D7APH8_9AGAR|nr:hypothetical protein FISHEDRAFT_55126 [Fistulina hepatica ATCC 64428]
MESADRDDLVRVDDEHTIKVIYETLWYEFHSKLLPDYLRGVIVDLGRSSTPSRTNCAHAFFLADSTSERSAPLGVSPPDYHVQLPYTVEFYDPNSGLLHVEQRNAEVVCSNDIGHLTPTPKYEFCSLTSRNTMSRGLARSAPFIPYIDDPSFSFRKNFSPYFRRLSWQSMIQAEESILLYRVLEQFRMKYQDLNIETVIARLDASSILPTCRGRKQGIIWKYKQRDIIPMISWQPTSDFDSSMMHLPHVDVPNNQVAAEDHMFENLGYFLDEFCPFLGCVTAFCEPHIGFVKDAIEADSNGEHQMQIGDLILDSIDHSNLQLPPFKSCSQLLTKDNACGDDCFLHLHTSDIETIVSLDDPTLIFAIQVLRLDPNGCPCDLAVICCLSCKNVFKVRQALEQKFPNLYDIPQLIKEKTFIKGCQHGTDSCTSPHVSTEVKAVIVQLENILVKTIKLVHVKKHFENAIPNIVSNVMHDNVQKQYLCCNIAIQYGDHHLLKIQKAKYGLGAFATTHICAGDLIGEYTGELWWQDFIETTAYANLHRYNDLNYHFALKSLLDEAETSNGRDWDLDSASAGNETRYINHASSSETINCIAEVRNVNGEYRIGIFATKDIRAGKELFLDYGEGYWI